MLLPTFHTMGMYQQVYSPLATGYPVAMFTPQARPRGHPGHQALPVAPTPEITLEVARRIGCDAALVIPSFLEVSFIIVVKRATIEQNVAF